MLDICQDHRNIISLKTSQYKTKTIQNNNINHKVWLAKISKSVMTHELSSGLSNGSFLEKACHFSIKDYVALKRNSGSQYLHILFLPKTGFI